MNVPARLLLALVAGAMVGGGAAAVLAAEDPEVSVPAAATTTVAVEEILVEAPWVEGGVRFRSSVLVPQAFVVGEGAAEVEFAVVPLHWTVREEEEPFPDALPVRPEVWELSTSGGALFEATTVVDDTVVWFEVPEGLEAEDVAGVRVTGWRIAVPVQSEVTLPLAPGERRSFPDGATVEVTTILSQTNSTIVQIDSTLPDSTWLGGGSLAPIRVTDPGWRVTFRFNQSSNIQLIWEGDGAPANVVLVQAYPEWTPVASDTVVIGPANE